MKALPYTYQAKGKYWYFRHVKIGSVRIEGLPFDHTFMWHYNQLLHKVGETKARKRANAIRRKNSADEGVYKLYFIGMGNDGPIKIGIAADVSKRLRKLQGGSPIELSILAICAGGPAIEKSLHQRFSQFRMKGEWFERSPELLAHIDHLNREQNENGANLKDKSANHG